ncbi:hypothetical protein FQR65_LT07402 [Abscondita terminalis]|nr:hypothetical protein FQR65_LT07402 [Abscondita terminalis]
MNISFGNILKKCLLVTFIWCLGVNQVDSAITLSSQSAFLEQGKFFTVVLRATNLTKTPFTVIFDVEQQDVANIYPNYIVLNETNGIFNLTLEGLGPGHTEIIASSYMPIDLTGAHITVNVCRSKILDIASQVVGWIFIISWGSSFYPQLYTNFKRKCVVGLNFDYLALNIVGYISFGAFILNLYFNPEVQREYFDKYPRGLIPVKLNDVVYNLHGWFAIILTVIQCCIYEKGNQKVSTTAKIIISCIVTLYTVCIILQRYLVMEWLDFLYVCSYVKIVVTLLKYIPQAYMNYKRKSTSGWSIGLVFLDFNGGFFSIMQMVFDAYNYDDWVSIFGNPTKFMLVLHISYGDIRISSQQLLIGLNKNQTVNIIVTDFNNTNAKLQFVVQHVDIIRIKPATITLEPYNKTYELVIEATSAGHSEVTTFVNSSNIDLSDLYFVANVCKSKVLDILSQICGWIFIISWGCAFYPQIYSNYKRKSVVGLNFDYVALNLIGYLSFGIFIAGLYFVPYIQQAYFELHPRGLIPVKENDVVYNAHGTLAILFTIFQCVIYERGSQAISTTAKILIGFLGTFYVICGILLCVNVVQWLNFLYYCSYLKLAITVLKYIPQAYMNYKRKSTRGWSIGLVLLDLNGGVFSLMQMIFDSYNYNDWGSIFGNPTKFGLGFFNIVIHSFFIVQHYCLYKNPPMEPIKVQNV